MIKNFPRRMAAAVAAGLLVVCLSAQAAASGAQADYTKIENVYARLAADGTPGAASVVNHFQVRQAGQITDYGSYQQAVNLSATDPLSVDGGTVRFAAEEGNFYYQGNLDSVALPWKFRISYRLDGKPMAPEDLGGKCGALEIDFHCRRDPKVPAVFSENYVMQVSLTLDNDVCANIQAPDGTLADAGDGTQLTFTVLPGSDADYTVTADVRDFSMSGFSIAAVPYSLSIDTESFETDDFSDQMDELTDGAQELRDGAIELSSGIAELKKGGDSIVDGSAGIRDGLKSLSTSGYELAESAKGISGSLSGINARLNGGDLSDLSELGMLAGELSQTAAALDSLCDSLETLRTDFSAGYSAMQTAVRNAGDSVLTQEEREAVQYFCANNSQAASGARKLLKNADQLQSLLSAWSTAQPGFQAVLDQLDPAGETSLVSQIRAAATQLRDTAASLSQSQEQDPQNIGTQLTILCKTIAALAPGLESFSQGLSGYADGVAAMAGQYGSFHNGLAEYNDGVGKLSGGAAELSGGVAEFADGVSEIPDKIQEAIDDMLDSFGGDFTPVSFVDSRNTRIGSVQFILSTDGISLPEVPAQPEQAPELSFLQRLAALFR